MKTRGSLLLACAVIAAIPAIADGPKLPGDTGTEKRSITFYNEIVRIADEQDKKPGDEWFSTGPRKFKSGYAKVSNRVKAAFSLDLQSWAAEKGERLADIPDTYIPYKKREEYAMWWWLTHDANYKKAAPWDKDQWKYESIIDGTRLIWKAGQNVGNSYSASMVMGHDALMAKLFKTEGK